MSIIHTRYESNRDAPSSQEREALKNLIAHQDKVQAAFGLEFLNEMINAQDRLDTVNLADSYGRGFTDCFQLWLEVFSKYSS